MVPISGFFEEWQAERLQALIPEKHRDILVALAEGDPDVESIRDHFDALSDLTADEFQKQIEDFESEMKKVPQGGGKPQGVS